MLLEGGGSDMLSRLSNLPEPYALANTVEDFDMPPNVVGYVVDKSSFARVFVTAFNTLIDPGFHGNLTLELVNLGPEVVEMKLGDPICQIAFHFLDRPTDRPYAGKYQHQTKKPHPARFETPIFSAACAVDCTSLRDSVMSPETGGRDDDCPAG
jgi:deoxycytidine triphosphate deaminase